MKRTILTAALSALSIMSALNLNAQSPEKMTYQAVVRNTSGNLVSNAPVGVRVSILQGSASGTEVFSETHTINSNENGLITFEIGSGTPVSGSVASIDWAAGPYYIKNEHDLNGGTNYTLIGTSQILSVPYALYAKNGLPDGTNGATVHYTGGQWVSTTNLFNSGSYVGVNHTFPIGSSVFDISATTGPGQWGGMYINTTDDEGKPFLGFSTNSNARSWFELRGLSGDLVYFNGNTDFFTISASNRIGVDNVNPQYKFQIDGITGGFEDSGIRLQNSTVGTGWSFYPSSSGDLIIGRLSNLGQFNGISGAYTSASDERLKKNIRPIESVLTKVTDMKIMRYEFIHNNPAEKSSIGVIAQELQQAFPELVSVHTTNDGNPSVENQLGVDYAGLSVVALKAIQEQQTIIEQQQQVIEELTKRLTALEQR